MNSRLVGAALMVGIAAGLLTACTNSGTASESVAAAPDRNSSGGDSAAKPESTGKGTVGERNVSQPGVDRSLVRTATLELTTADVGEAVGRARDIAATEGGYTGRESVRAESAQLTLHIPSDRFDAALDALSELGEVESREQSAEDVTEQVVDLDSRIATQRASVDRVRALLARAGTVDEIVRIEQEVTTREAELESLQQRRETLGGQVAMSTVTITFARTHVAPPPVEEEEATAGFLTGLSDGWGAFLAAGAVMLRVVGALLPFALVILVPGVPLVRWWRRRRATTPVTTPVAQQP